MPKRGNKSNLGELIKSHRLILNMTQEELADKLNISFQQIQKYEYNLNTPSIEIAKKLCKVLKIPSEKVFGDYNSADLLKEADKELVKEYEYIKILKKYPKLKDLLRYYDKNFSVLSHINLTNLLKSLSISREKDKR